MGFFKGAKSALDAFRCFTRASTQFQQGSRIHRPAASTLASGVSKRAPDVVAPCPLVLRRFSCYGVIGRNRCNPFSNGAKRFYYVDRYQVQHFKPRGPRRWFRNPRNVLIVVLVGSGVFITVYFGNLEEVPYTKRRHFVLLSRDWERRLGETQFQQIKASFKGKILPPIHPESVRVRLIAKDIIEALQRGLRHEQVWQDISYASPDTFEGSERGAHDTLMALSDKKSEKLEETWSREDELLDDSWVDQSRNKGRGRGSKPTTSHLEGLNWEVLVVNEPVVNAFCLPGGKIVVFTGLFEHFRTDAEIATIIGHEVAHAVARHSAEMITKNLWFNIMQLILYQFVMPDIVNAMSSLFLRLPFSRKVIVMPSKLTCWFCGLFDA
ncbi:mitochondrial metalloendopeptidase OMA1 isoform X2 [Rhodamnia argentea]|uniref:Mitochondrial metalloendopeptidase OMA1 isoform X2 n=1 Tax=Rhodamnia argentea TaxID=178133 RepID=A0ABM3GRV4_9MYRT|nr:mitochondrial metalloendopeptidase OMA1 isoform X2 [Rhodamnia argentea]